MSVFKDILALTGDDPDHAEEEFRYILMGISSTGRLLLVSYTERHDKIRLISARLATKRERKDYEDGNFP
jgi:hypothetical protein